MLAAHKPIIAYQYCLSLCVSSLAGSSSCAARVVSTYGSETKKRAKEEKDEELCNLVITDLLSVSLFCAMEYRNLEA
jgi:hypothetical protein